MKGQHYRVIEAILLTLFLLSNLFMLEKTKCPTYLFIDEETGIKKKWNEQSWAYNLLVIRTKFYIYFKSKTFTPEISLSILPWWLTLWEMTTQLMN